MSWECLLQINAPHIPSCLLISQHQRTMITLYQSIALLKAENTILVQLGQSEKDGYKIFPHSEYSTEDAERFFQVYSRKYTEYFMSVQAVAYLLGKCGLGKGLDWSEGDDPRFLTSTQIRNNSCDTGEANEQEITVSCRWSQRWRRKMFWNFESDVVLKI